MDHGVVCPERARRAVERARYFSLCLEARVWLQILAPLVRALLEQGCRELGKRGLDLPGLILAKAVLLPSALDVHNHRERQRASQSGRQHLDQRVGPVLLLALEPLRRLLLDDPDPRLPVWLAPVVHARDLRHSLRALDLCVVPYLAVSQFVASEHLVPQQQLAHPLASPSRTPGVEELETHRWVAAEGRERALG